MSDSAFSSPFSSHLRRPESEVWGGSFSGTLYLLALRLVQEWFLRQTDTDRSCFSLHTNSNRRQTTTLSMLTRYVTGTNGNASTHPRRIRIPICLLIVVSLMPVTLPNVCFVKASLGCKARWSRILNLGPLPSPVTISSQMLLGRSLASNIGFMSWFWGLLSSLCRLGEGSTSRCIDLHKHTRRVGLSFLACYCKNCG